MERTRDMEFQMVGKIFWDPQNRQFDIDNKRPAFKRFVRRYMNNGQNRCHSISFYLLSVLLCDFSNNLNQATLQAAIRHMQATFGYGIGMNYSGAAIPWRSSVTYIRQLNNYVTRLCNKINRAAGPHLIENELSQFLSHLNSCPYNLRYPVNVNANWNQAVGEDFDPRMWCYVDAAGNVISDDQSLTPAPTAFGNYCAARGRGALPAVVGAGFYLLEKADNFLVSRMFDLATQGFLSQQYLNAPQLFLSSSVTTANGNIPANVPYLPSSSNNYPVQANNPFQANIYFYDTFSRQWKLF